MTTQIIIHLMPYEIDWFEWQVKQLKLGSYYLTVEDKVVIDVTLNLNLTDWKHSKIEKQFFIDKFNNVLLLLDWCKVISDINEDGTCMGCMDKRRSSLRSYDVDNFIWLDCDLIFNMKTLKVVLDSAKLVDSKYYIISPQITKLWDASWDCLVNESYIKDKWEQPNPNLPPINLKDPYSAVVCDYGDIRLKYNLDFKFAGGWFNLLSTNLLKLIDLPDSMGSYGPDDTFVMESCKILRHKGLDIQQYVLENLIVVENLKYRVNNYEKYLQPLNDKSGYRKGSEEVFYTELTKLTVSR